jgi:hypothetical protein
VDNKPVTNAAPAARGSRLANRPREPAHRFIQYRLPTRSVHAMARGHCLICRLSPQPSMVVTRRRSSRNDQARIGGPGESVCRTGGGVDKQAPQRDGRERGLVETGTARVIGRARAWIGDANCTFGHRYLGCTGPIR